MASNDKRAAPAKEPARSDDHSASDPLIGWFSLGRDARVRSKQQRRQRGKRGAK